MNTRSKNWNVIVPMHRLALYGMIFVGETLNGIFFESVVTFVLLTIPIVMLAYIIDAVFESISLAGDN